jgi:SAM-dependent methyltransferase
VIAAIRNALRRRKDETPDWVKEGELSARGAELRYWQTTGLDKGADLYGRYFAAFGVDPAALEDATVADFGSGPFGGVLSVLPRCRTGYPIDVLADEYNEWRKSPHPIVKFAGGPTSVPEAACDYVFSTNAIDHTPRPDLIADEIERILRPGGRFFLHVHARTDDELNKIHPVPWDEGTVRRVFGGFEVEELRSEERDRVNGGPYRTIYAKLRKPAGA